MSRSTLLVSHRRRLLERRRTRVSADDLTGPRRCREERHVEIRQLRYFVAVAETRQLEAQVGATLFTRTTRRVELTAAGEAFLRDAERILEAVDAARTRVQLIADGSSGLLRVGATGLAALRQLPQLARIAARETPGLVLRYQPDLLTPAQELALAEDRIDLAVLRPPLRRTGLSSRLITRERLVLAVPDSSRLAGAEPVALADLREEDFIVYGAADSVVNAVVTQACLGAGFLPRRAHEVAETSIMLTHVAAGLGVALMPESALALHVEGVAFVPVADHVRIDVSLAWRTDDRSPALATLLRALEAHGFLASGTETSPDTLTSGATR
jgi:DNA-binding transcriptional LysR family regulator